MENHDKIFEHFKEVADQAESKEFPAMDKVWSRVEGKLDYKAVEKSAGLWKKIAVAASFLLFFTLGYQLLRNDQASAVVPKNQVTATPDNSVKDSQPIVAEPHDDIRPAASRITQIAETAPVSHSDPPTPGHSVNMQTSGVTLQDPGLSEPAAQIPSTTNYETITGIVSDQIGSLSGANVVVMGTNRGTKTDADGKYSIEARKGEQLVFSSGMKELVTTVGSQNQIDAELPQEYMKSAVADNYSDDKSPKVKAQSRKLKVTVESRNLSEPASTETETGNSANVGFMGNAPTLYIIDGVPSTESQFRQIKAEEIESMKLLTESEAKSVYGNKAVSGAMIVSKKAAKTSEPLNWNEDESLAENGFESPMTAPLSTFMLNLENSSYTEIRNAINKGVKVPAESVRIAEMINYFEYKYPQPQDQNPVSINAEYSSCPWNSKHKLVKIGLQGKNAPGVIAKDVRIQIEFNPMIVKGYRLIGYEKRKPRTEDFKNISKTTEINGSHTVTALYEVIPIDVESQYFEEPDGLKYTKINTGTTFGNELATVKFRYKKSDAGKSIEMVKVIPNKAALLQNSSADFRFCASVAWFGLKLRESELIGNRSKSDLLKLAKGSLSADSDGSRSEFIRLVEAAKW